MFKNQFFLFGGIFFFALLGFDLFRNVFWLILLDVFFSSFCFCFSKFVFKVLLWFIVCDAKLVYPTRCFLKVSLSLKQLQPSWFLLRCCFKPWALPSLVPFGDDVFSRLLEGQSKWLSLINFNKNPNDLLSPSVSNNQKKANSPFWLRLF